LRFASFSVNTRGTIRTLAGELAPGNALADDLAHGKIKALAIVQLTIIETVHLFIEVAEQMERLD
jgi:hypothetical protein